MQSFQVLTAGLLVSGALGCRGGDRPPTELSEPRLARAGATIRTAHYAIVASAAKDCPPPERDATLGPQRRVGVELWLEPSSSVQVPANPYYAKLIDSEGAVHEATLGGCGTPFGPALPVPGRPSRGWVVFDVPRAAQGFTLVYAPPLIGMPTEEVAIDLSAQSPR